MPSVLRDLLNIFRGQRQPPPEPAAILPDKPPPPPPPPGADPDKTYEDLPALPEEPRTKPPPHAPSQRGKRPERPTPPEGTPLIIDDVESRREAWRGNGFASCGYLTPELTR